MQKIFRGVQHFRQSVFGERRELFQRLASGQQPEALFITCSDSRINPNLVTQTEPGDLFILRNAGNLIPAHGHGGGEAATIEYALSILGVQDIVVCGHSNCGAMAALLQPGATRDLPEVERWLGHAAATRSIIEQNHATLEPAERVLAAAQENVLVQLNNLRTHPTVAASLSTGRLRLHGWVYKFEEGEILNFDEPSAEWINLETVDPLLDGLQTRRRHDVGVGHADAAKEGG